MCRERTGLIAVASVFGLVQSILWIGALIVVILIYCCAIPPVEYVEENDFFKVTLVKLYFEGPRCIPDGRYLGKFGEEYKQSISLLARDIIMFVVIVYIVLSVVYFFLSIALYLVRQKQRKRFFLVTWSAVTLIICALDALLTYSLVRDSFSLKEYLTENKPNEWTLGGLPYIPLALAVISSRFVVIWIWNFFMGIYTFCIGLCGKPAVKAQLQKVEEKAPEKVEEKQEEKPKENPAEAKPSAEEGECSVSLIQGNFSSMFDIKSHPDYTDYRRTLEAVTRFPSEEKPPKEYHHRGWWYAPPSEISVYPKSHSNKEWEATNEGYVHDEQVAGEFDFDHNLKNFESGQRKTKTSRPPIGKPVRIPVPPPMPPFGSCNC